jgi:alkaline phosphatase D
MTNSYSLGHWRSRTGRAIIQLLTIALLAPSVTLAQTPDRAEPVKLSTPVGAPAAKPTAKTSASKASTYKQVAAKPKPSPVAPPTPTRAYLEPPRRVAPTDLLRSGPMVTYSAMREVGLWAQLSRAGGVQVEYWVKGKPERRWRTAVVLTTGPDHLAELVADSVQPGQKYSYRLWAADMDHVRLGVIVRPYPLEFQSQPLWQWRTDPPAVRVALGSCTYVNDSLYDRPGKPYGGDYNIFRGINMNRPDAMVWLGDNTYLRESDWDSPGGIRRRYAHTRALPALQPLLGSVHQYATWDDHDFGPNDADRSFALKEASLQTFKSYWPNPAYGAAGVGGVTSTFTWADIQFFLLDDRWHRTPNADDPAHGQLLGPEQLRWLTEALTSSKATFKVVCLGNQVMNPAKTFENYANYEAERAELLRRLADTRVPGVLFVTGDRHHAELTRLDRPGLYPLYDLTTSPLTANPMDDNRREPNPLRDTATFRAERNFTLLDVTGPLADRRLTMTLCNIEGRPIWKRELRAADLQPGATAVQPTIVPTTAASGGVAPLNLPAEDSSSFAARAVSGLTAGGSVATAAGKSRTTLAGKQAKGKRKPKNKCNCPG